MNFGENAGLVIPSRSQRWKVWEQTFVSESVQNPTISQISSCFPPIPAHVTAVRVTCAGSSDGMGTNSEYYNGGACTNVVLPVGTGERLVINGNLASFLICVVQPTASGQINPTVADAKYALLIANGASLYVRGTLVANASSFTIASGADVTKVVPALNGSLHGSAKATGTATITSACTPQFVLTATQAPSHLFGFDTNAQTQAGYRGHPGQGPTRATGSFGSYNPAYVKLEWVE